MTPASDRPFMPVAADDWKEPFLRDAAERTNGRFDLYTIMRNVRESDERFFRMAHGD